MSDIEKSEDFSVASLPHAIIVAAKRADGDIEELASDIEFEYPSIELDRSQLRDILNYVAVQNEMDIVAGTPNSTEALTRLIDDSMFREIQRLNREVRILSKIAEKHSGSMHRVKSTGEQITPEQAQNRLAVAMSQLAAYSKTISDREKGKVGPDININNNLDLTGLVTEGLKRVETLDISQ